jgi:hypothetical protein
MIIKIAVAIIAGGLIGGFGGHLLKYSGGSCPLTCNPWGGAILGIVLSLSFVFRLI